MKRDWEFDRWEDERKEEAWKDDGRKEEGSLWAVTEGTTLGELLAMLSLGERPRETPTPRRLREEAGEPVAAEARCAVYRNGFAVYDNGSGRTVLWLGDCLRFTHRFGPLRKKEKGGDGGLPEAGEIPEELLAAQPWAVAVTLAGDHQAEKRVMHRKGDRKGIRSEIREERWEGGPEASLRTGGDPEAEMIRREAWQEMMEDMTGRQREVFRLYFREGCSRAEIAEMLGIDASSVRDRLAGALRKARKIFAEETPF